MQKKSFFFIILLFLLALPFAYSQIIDKTAGIIPTATEIQFSCTQNLLTGAILCTQPVSNVSKVENVETVNNVKTAERITNQPEIAIHGTEYQVNENGKVFLQLQQGGVPINNGTCNVDIFYPNATIFQRNAPMLLISNSNGLYEFNSIIPNTIGTYPISAKCNFANNIWFFNNPDKFPFLINTANITLVSGTFAQANESNNVNLPDDNQYLSQASTIAGTREANLTIEWDLKLSTTNITNATQIDLFWKGQTNSNPTVFMRIFNFSSNKFVKLPNSVNSNLEAPSSTATGTFDIFLANSIISNEFISNNSIVRVKIESADNNPQANFVIYHNWINARISGSTTTIIDVKGSSEWHITSFLNDIKTYLLDTITRLLNDTISRQETINRTIKTQISDLNASINIDFNMMNINLNNNFSLIRTQIYDLNISLQNYISTINQSIISSIENNISIEITNAQNSLGTDIRTLNTSLQSFITINELTLNNSIQSSINFNTLSLNISLQNFIDARNVILNSSIISAIGNSTNIALQEQIYALNTSLQSFISLQNVNLNASIISNVITNISSAVSISQFAIQQNIYELNISLQSFILSQNLILSNDIKINTSNSQTSIEALIRAVNFSLNNEIQLQQSMTTSNITLFVSNVNTSLTTTILSANITSISNITTINIPANETATLTVGVCATNTSQTLMIWLFVAIALVLLFIALKFASAITGIFAGLCLFISAIYVSPCGIGFGIILGGLGIVMIAIFGFLTLKGK